MAKDKHECPPHHFLIDSNDVGVCRHCGEVRDFGLLLRKNGMLEVARKRGAKARQETLGKKRGRKKRKKKEALS